MMKSLARARLKRVTAVELLVKGRSYEQIAREVGFSHRGSAHRAVHKALAEREVEAVDDMRMVELARLDQLQATLWPTAMEGDLAAITVIVRIIGQRCRLLNLQLGSEAE